MRVPLILSALALATTACAGNTGAPLPAPVVGPPPLSDDGSPDTFALAMETVDTLVAAGNEQKAIDRLTQLLGDPALTTEETETALMRRAELRYGPGNDVEGAVRDYAELIDMTADEQAQETYMLLASEARMEMDILLAALDMPDLQPTDEFEILFRLGRHQDAADLMLSRNLTPRDSFLLDMYQIGYLCDDPALSGPSYEMPGPEQGTMTVHFCDFGK